MSIPRPEYPRPQFVRERWLNLNGSWQFEMDPGDSGKERGLLERALGGTITVPFCMESSLSGVGHTDFMAAVWYRREVGIPGDWAGQRVVLHIGGCDYDTTVWVNGTEVGRHRGGFTPIACELHGVAGPGEKATIVIRARDYNKGAQPRGKQSVQYAPHACWYTRTTGIWQTVWMEPVPACALKRPKLTPDVGNGMIRLVQGLTQNAAGMMLRAILRDEKGEVCRGAVRADLDLSPRVDLAIPEDRRKLWGPGSPHLYDVEIELVDREGKVVDRAKSYAGLRSVAIDGTAVKINGKAVFQRLVLDQGYYPDGVLTAPTDDALARDIEMSMAAGFNGARLHQKVFEERFLYHADRLGYLVWGEFADWGCSGNGPMHDHQRPGPTYATQWLEALERDYSHPSIVGWCPLNETSQVLHDGITQLDDVTWALWLAAKAADPTRPVLDTSGYAHRVPMADVYDSHDYIAGKEIKTKADWWKAFEKFKARYAPGSETMYVNQMWDASKNRLADQNVAYRGQPYLVSEFGGLHWNPEVKTSDKTGETSWGYGDAPDTVEEFYARFAALCGVLLENPKIFGYCYTQLTDVYPEENGIFTFDRRGKFDLGRLREAQERAAGVEK